MEVPKDITEALGALYPGVELIYSLARQKFFLVQRTPRGVRVMDCPFNRGAFIYPNFCNTIGWLTEHDHRELDTAWKREAFLKSLDDHKERYDRAKLQVIRDMIQTDAKDMMKSLRAGMDKGWIPPMTPARKRRHLAGG